MIIGKRGFAAGCAMVAMILCGSAVFAGSTQYVITNDDVVAGPNTLTVFSLNSSTGALTHVKTIQTNGFGVGGGFFSTPRLAVNSNCIFATDSGTTVDGVQIGDIAAILASTFALVGNYSDATLSGVENGIGLVLNPNGQYLYAAYTTSKNIGVWQIGANCSLTLVNSYKDGGQVAGMAMAQQSSGAQYLVTSYPYYPFQSYVNLFIISGGGSTLAQEAVGEQPASGSPGAVQVTDDGNVAVFGDTNDYAEMESWWISTTPGSCNPAAAPPPCLIGNQDFKHLGPANNSTNIRLSPAAASNPTTGGCLYIANNSDYRVSTETFVEGTAPGTVSLTRTVGSPFTVTVAPGEIYAADIHVSDSSPTGGMIVMAEFPNYILTAPVNSDCSLGASVITADNSLEASVLSLGITAPGTAH
jgi:hypothetical protein